MVNTAALFLFWTKNGVTVQCLILMQKFNQTKTSSINFKKPPLKTCIVGIHATKVEQILGPILLAELELFLYSAFLLRLISL
jgi:hypothetical protein